ncbi:unnamed protein product [Durusdinium trenchii]|uniref:Uncharacterized protein n=1 Tax=Durusdinium trenchii TaxID=1381693 RepID=A0ABP0MRP5_9DINO
MATSKSSGSASPASSSSSSSSSHEEEKPSVTLGNSDTSTEAENAPAKARAYAGMFTWPCPRHFFQDLEDRRAAKVLKPCDVSKEKLLEAFTKALKSKGYLHNLVKAAVADEPHKHYQPDGASRERHKHLIFLFRAPFVHAGVRKLLAEEFGYHGFFTFHRAGWCAYLDYLMMESAKKPAHDLDRDLVFYPSSYTKQKADGELAGMSSQVAGRKKNEGLQKGPSEALQKRRRRMSFSELTDFVVERKISTVAELWKAAEEEKMRGNSLVWDHVGQLRDPAAEVQKILAAWHRPETLGASTLITSPRFPLEHFDVPPRVLQWKETQSLTHTLILRGPPGTGKTEMAISVLLSTCRAGIHFVSKLDQMHKITVHPGEGLVVDEACFRTVSIDDAKAWCDVTHARDVHNRCSDGHIPAQTPRIFTTNHEVPQFWPPEYFHSSHQAAIDRRTVWVDCPNKLFKDREATCKGNNVTLRSAIQGRCIAPQKCVTQVVSEVH